MKKLSFYKVKSKELNEYQLSIIIHLVILSLLSIIISLKSTSQIKPKVIPVTLIHKIEKNKKESISEKSKTSAIKKSENKSNNIAKKQSKLTNKNTKTSSKPVIKSSSKSNTKNTTKKTTVSSNKIDNKKQTKETKIQSKAKVSSPVSAKPTQKNLTSKVEAPIETIKPAQTNLPSVIDRPSNNTTIKPSHNAPLFEEKNELNIDLNKNSPLSINNSSSNNSANASLLLTEPILDDNMMFATPTDFSTQISSNESENKGNDQFSVGSIDSFGDNSDNFTAPKIISKVEPEYPEWARKQGVHGNAVYRVLILPSGTVADVVTMSSTIDPKLAINGAQALRRWVFTPILKKGVPQETWVKITVKYELN